MSDSRSWAVTAAAVVISVLPAAVAGAAAPICGYEIVAVYPHDTGAFTEGLLYDDGDLLESTGNYHHSSVRRVDLTTGTVLDQQDLAQEQFGEGLARVGERLFQLTWQEHTGLIWDRATLEPVGTFSFGGEGWGLAYDGEHLVRSDGSSTLELWDATTLTPVGTIAVRNGGAPVPNLNELEVIDGEIFANVWLTDHLVRIDPTTGNVSWVVDLSGLLASQGGAPGAEVLNGIAWDPAGRRLFVTGKWWPWLFEIELPDCPIGLVFRDGFESGGTGAWTDELPLPDGVAGQAVVAPD